MRNDPGKMDRRLTILSRVAAQEDVYGTSSGSWQPLETVWAEIQDVLPSRSERVADSIDIARRPARIRIRWRSDLTSAMRLRLEDGRELKIVAGPAELGRRDRLELMAEEITTEGAEL